MFCYIIKNPNNYKYYIFNFNIEFEFKDLGIIFDTKLTFLFYWKMIKNKDMHVLDFMGSICS